jgi:hypothetical protein
MPIRHRAMHSYSGAHCQPECWRSSRRGVALVPKHGLRVMRPHVGTHCGTFSRFQSAKRAMIPHPSLTAPFLPPPPLRPQRTMDPYKPCWCQSGKKWKWCHKNRHIQKPLPLGQVLSSIHVEFTKGYCSYPGAGPATCGERIIRAHTVQRATGLAAIAERGHVISAKSAFKDTAKNEGSSFRVKSASMMLLRLLWAFVTDTTPQCFGRRRRVP